MKWNEYAFVSDPRTRSMNKCLDKLKDLERYAYDSIEDKSPTGGVLDAEEVLRMSQDLRKELIWIHYNPEEVLDGYIDDEEDEDDV